MHSVWRRPTVACAHGQDLFAFAGIAMAGGIWTDTAVLGPDGPETRKI
jgi:hypothetical protein